MRFATRPPIQAVLAGLAFAWATAASAVTVEVNAFVGSIPLGTANNEFLPILYLDGAGNQSAVALAIVNGAFVLGQTSDPHAITSHPEFIYNYHFDVATPAVLSQNLGYMNNVGSTAASLTLMSGTTVVWEATRTDSSSFPDGSDFRFPATLLNPAASYTMVIRTPGLTSPVDVSVPTNYAWGQIAFDVSPVPEPASGVLLAAGLVVLLAARRGSGSAAVAR